MFGRVYIEHEVGQCALKLCALVPVNSETRARKFGGPFHIEKAKLLAQFPMWFRLKVELRWLAPAADLNIVVLTAPNRHAGVWQVRDLRHYRTQLFFELSCELLLPLAFLAQRLSLLH